MKNNLDGSGWHKGDFHVHTPFSRSYEQHGVTAKDFLEKTGELDFVIVADHNSFDGYFHLLEFKGPNPVLFPGVELKVPGGFGGLNLAVILDPKLNQEELEMFLRELGLTPANKGDDSVITPCSLSEMARIIHKYEGIVVWTKAFTKQGLAGGVDPKQREFICGLDWPVSAVDLENKQEADLALPWVWGSNAHKLADIGRNTTHIKVETLDFNGLKFALRDPEARVRCGFAAAEYGHPKILSLKVRGGFLTTQEFTFNAGLNCLIGERGTGKTTVIRLLAFALGTLDLKDNLCEQVSVELLDSKGRYLRVIRQANHPPKVLDRFGRPVKDDLREFCLLFHQGDIEKVVLKPEYQLDLLDSTWDSAQAKKAYREVLKALDDNDVEMEETGTQLDNLLEQLAGKEAIELRLRELQGYPLNEIQRGVAEHNREVQALNQIHSLIKQNTRLLQQIAQPVNSFPLPEFLANTYRVTKQGIKQLLEVWRQAEDELTRQVGEAEERHAALEEEYRSMLGNCPDSRIRELIREREQIRDELVALEPLEKELDIVRERLAVLEERRMELLQDWTSLGEKIFEHRLRAAENLNRELAPLIKIEVIRRGFKLPLEDFLRLNLEGGKVLRVIERLDPGELFRVVSRGEHEVLAGLSGLPPERCRQIIAKLGKRRILLALERLEIPDLVQIYLKDGKMDKPGAELSTGQRCTVVLPLILLTGKGPLIIDQPEDQLDNAYVYSVLVQQLRELKSKRQFIFATHNPNIPVLGDAEQNFVLESNGSAGWIRAKGSVENTKVKDLIQGIMEGGKDAFAKRARCYG